MNVVLEQLGLDHTLYIELGIFAILFLILSHLYFKPFLKLFEARYKKTVSDREKAEQLMADAQKKLDDYQRILMEARVRAKAEYELALNEAKKQESEQLGRAREEAKKITHQTIELINQQRVVVRKQLSADIETIAQTISEKLLSRKL